MGKPFHVNKNAFSLVEMLLVLLIISVLSFGVYTSSHSSLYIFMKKLESYCLIAQQKAYIEKRVVNVKVNGKIYIANEMYDIPKDIRGDERSSFFNEKGNISKAGHITCSNQSQSMNLIFQLGTGRMRIEK